MSYTREGGVFYTLPFWSYGPERNGQTDGQTNGSIS